MTFRARQGTFAPQSPALLCRPRGRPKRRPPRLLTRGPMPIPRVQRTHLLDTQLYFLDEQPQASWNKFRKLSDDLAASGLGRVVFASYESGQPQVYLLQLETGQRELVGNFPGMTFAPRFSPDGQKVIMSLLRD